MNDDLTSLQIAEGYAYFILRSEQVKKQQNVKTKTIGNAKPVKLPPRKDKQTIQEMKDVMMAFVTPGRKKK